MITLGIDLASQAERTVACVIVWGKDRAVARPPVLKCNDDTLDALIAEANAIGVDAPLGWPQTFVDAVANWTSTKWNGEIRDSLRFRETDRVVCRDCKLNPLSVSSDLIALPAMRAMALLKRHHVNDRSGDGRFFEVYPAASLRAWNFNHHGYKDAVKDSCRAARREILAGLQSKMPWLEVPDGYDATSDTLDALVASLTTWTAAQGLTRRPDQNQIAIAKCEGWIHIPTKFPTL